MEPHAAIIFLGWATHGSGLVRLSDVEIFKIFLFEHGTTLKRFATFQRPKHFKSLF